MASENREVVKQLLGKHGRLTSAQIMEHIDSIENERQLSNLLYNMKNAGEITRNDDRTYSLPGEGSSSPRDIVNTMPAPAPKEKRRGGGKRAAPSPSNGGAAATALHEAMHRTQLALDEYLLSVGDANIIEPLKAARDSARAAYERYLSKNPE